MRFLIAISLAIAVSGCAGNSTQEAAEPDDSVVGGEFRDGSAETGSLSNSTAPSGFDVGTVYFALNESAISPDAQEVLNRAGAELKEAGTQVVIEGHCDELGSDEYNLALGERRAQAVEKYLYNVGVSLDQMETVSYGESKPAVRGSGERAWQLNRRAVIGRR